MLIPENHISAAKVFRRLKSHIARRVESLDDEDIDDDCHRDQVSANIRTAAIQLCERMQRPVEETSMFKVYSPLHGIQSIQSLRGIRRGIDQQRAPLFWWDDSLDKVQRRRMLFHPWREVLASDFWVGSIKKWSSDSLLRQPIRRYYPTRLNEIANTDFVAGHLDLSRLVEMADILRSGLEFADKSNKYGIHLTHNYQSYFENTVPTLLNRIEAYTKSLAPFSGSSVLVTREFYTTLGTDLKVTEGALVMDEEDDWASDDIVDVILRLKETDSSLNKSDIFQELGGSDRMFYRRFIRH